MENYNFLLSRIVDPEVPCSSQGGGTNEIKELVSFRLSWSGMREGRSQLYDAVRPARKSTAMAVSAAARLLRSRFAFGDATSAAKANLLAIFLSITGAGTRGRSKSRGLEQMLMRIILLLVQLAGAWIGAKFLLPIIAPYLGSLGDLKIFAYAVLFAIIMFIIGFIASAALRDIRSPTSGTLTFSLILGLIGAGVTLVPAVMSAIPLDFDKLLLPLLGAALGYFVKR